MKHVLERLKKQGMSIEELSQATGMTIDLVKETMEQ